MSMTTSPNKTTQTDAEGRQTSWEYDYFGRVTQRCLPLSAQGQPCETFTYDDLARTMSHTDFNGQTHTAQMDLMGRMQTMTYADGEIESFTYWPNGQIKTATYSEGVHQWFYDHRDRLSQEIKPNGATLDYEYDLVSNRTQVELSHNLQTITFDYTFDSLNRLKTVTDDNGTTNYSYNEVGSRESVLYPNGVSQIYAYDSLNRLESIATYNNLGQLIDLYTYDLHVTGRREALTELNGRTSSWGYDDLYRLTNESITDPVNGNHVSSYVYDKVGNRKEQTINGSTTIYGYDLNDRLETAGITSYSYDHNGNTLTESDGVINKVYGYNSKNQLTGVDVDGTVTQFGYDINGIRNSKTEAGVTTDFITDSNRSYAQVLLELENNSAVAVYTYGDDLVSQSQSTGVNYFVYDGLGSTRMLTDETGAVTDQYAYQAFGELLGSSGTTVNDYLYVGEQFDSSVDKYYLRARYMDTGTGNFLTQDTWQGNMQDPVTLHKYLYGNSDAVNGVDPSGNMTLSDIGAAIRVVGTLSVRAVRATNALFRKAFTSGGAGAVNILTRSGQMLRAIAKKCKPGGAKKGNICTYAIGYVKAHLKMELLLARTPAKWTKKKGVSTVVAAFDFKTTSAAAAFNLGKQERPKTHSSLASIVSAKGATLGCADDSIFGGGNFKFGNCGEFLAANKVLFMKGTKKKRIRWTLAYSIKDRKRAFAARGDVKPYCPNCVGMFYLRNK